MKKAMFLPILCLLSVLVKQSNSGAVQLDSTNIDNILAENEFVFINFYADWCRFSNMLAPIWDEGADKIDSEMAGKSVVVGKVDCDKEGALGTRFHITKYPTIKSVRNGQLSKREYRGQRSAEAFLEFAQENTKNPVVEFDDLQDLNDLDDKKRYIIGYFESQEGENYAAFKKAATNLKDDCIFYAGFGATVEKMHPPGHDIVAFRTNKHHNNEDDEAYNGNLGVYDELSAWTLDKCSPLVREITFENAEELTEEGLPFLILFHAPDDNESIKEYNDLVSKELLVEKQNVNFLTADGVKFAHPLHHLGKSKEDLPLLAVDSFRHMYLFPKYEDSKTPGKVKGFLQDLYSGKLHREFHYGPDEATEDDKEEEEEKSEEGDDDKDKAETPEHIARDDDAQKVKKPVRARSTDPPESTFVHLGPSKNRYTFKDEF